MSESRLSALRKSRVFGSVAKSSAVVAPTTTVVSSSSSCDTSSSFSSRGKSGRKFTHIVKCLTSYPNTKSNSKKTKKLLTNTEQEQLLQKGVQPEHLLSVLKWIPPGFASSEELKGAQHGGGGGGPDRTILSSHLYFVNAHVITAEREVVYGRWPSDSGSTAIDTPQVLGPEFDIYVSLIHTNSYYSGTSYPYMRIDKNEEVTIRAKPLTLTIARNFMQSVNLNFHVKNLVISLLFLKLKKVEEYVKDELFTKLCVHVAKKELLEYDERWDWPKGPKGIPIEYFKEACLEATEYPEITEGLNPWLAILSTIRGRRYFLEKEIYAIEDAYTLGGKLPGWNTISITEGLLRLNPVCIMEMAEKLRFGDPFNFCFQKLSPVSSILPELSSVSYRNMAFQRTSSVIPTQNMIAVAIYQEALLRDANPFYSVSRIPRDKSLSYEERVAITPVYYSHADDTNREGSKLEDSSGHCFTHLSTLKRLFSSGRAGVDHKTFLTALVLLKEKEIVAIAPALCHNDDQEKERHIYLREMYQDTLDLVASIVEIERRAQCWKESPSSPSSPSYEGEREKEKETDKIVHSEDQACAISDFLTKTSPGGALCGRAGTGKTTTISGIVKQYKKKEILACALTAKASQVLDNITPADTAHHYQRKHENFEIGLVEKSNNQKEEKEEEEEDEKSIFHGKKLFIVDETSLMPLSLLSKLMKGLVQFSRVNRFLFSGDPDQLPSIEAGNILADVVLAYQQLDEEREPNEPKRYHCLTVCHRTDRISLHHNAESIKNGSMDLIDCESFTILESKGNLEEDTNQLLDYVASKIGEEEMKTQFQIQCSQNKFVQKVNEIVYRRYWENFDRQENYQQQQQTSGKRKRNEPYYYRPGLKLCFPKNNRTFHIKNGQILEVLRYEDEEKKTGKVLTMQDGSCIQHQKHMDHLVQKPNSPFRRVMYCKVHNSGSKKEKVLRLPLDIIPLNSSQVQLAYCLTGHKAQGTEFDHVGIILNSDESSFSSMENRTWLYTTTTRTKKSCTIIATESALKACLERAAPKRLSDLPTLLIYAIRELRTQFQTGVSPTESWWKNNTGMKPFTACSGWNRFVPEK